MGAVEVRQHAFEFLVPDGERLGAVDFNEGEEEGLDFLEGY